MSAAPRTPPPPLLLVNAESDWGLEVHTAALLPLLARAGHYVEHAIIKGTSHLSIYYLLGVRGSAAERTLVPMVTAFVAKASAGLNSGGSSGAAAINLSLLF